MRDAVALLEQARVTLCEAETGEGKARRSVHTGFSQQPVQSLFANARKYHRIANYTHNIAFVRSIATDTLKKLTTGHNLINDTITEQCRHLMPDVDRIQSAGRSALQLVEDFSDFDRSNMTNAIGIRDAQFEDMPALLFWNATDLTWAPISSAAERIQRQADLDRYVIDIVLQWNVLLRKILYAFDAVIDLLLSALAKATATWDSCKHEEEAVWSFRFASKLSDDMRHLITKTRSMLDVAIDSLNLAYEYLTQTHTICDKIRYIRNLVDPSPDPPTEETITPATKTKTKKKKRKGASKPMPRPNETVVCSQGNASVPRVTEPPAFVTKDTGAGTSTIEDHLPATPSCSGTSSNDAKLEDKSVSVAETDLGSQTADESPLGNDASGGSHTADESRLGNGTSGDESCTGDLIVAPKASNVVASRIVSKPDAARRPPSSSFTTLRWPTMQPVRHVDLLDRLTLQRRWSADSDVAAEDVAEQDMLTHDLREFFTLAVLGRRQDEAHHNLGYGAILQAVGQLFPSAAVKLAGSIDYGLHLPAPVSDLDLVIQHPTLSTEAGLQILYLCIRADRRFSSVNYIPTASTPVIKATVVNSLVNIDITWNVANVDEVRNLISTAVAQYPFFMPITLYLKHYLYMHGLGTPYHGGLGAFPLYLLVIFHHQVRRGIMGLICLPECS